VRQPAFFAEGTPKIDLHLVREAPNWEAWCGLTLRVDVAASGLIASLPMRWCYNAAHEVAMAAAAQHPCSQSVPPRAT